MSKPKIVQIDIDTVEPHPDNPRVHDLDAIAASLERFGQTKPIIVQKSTNFVVAGNGTRLAAKEKLGWAKIDALVVDRASAPPSGAKASQKPATPKAPKDRAESEPMRDIVMLMTVSRAAEFAKAVQTLQKVYGTKSVVDTVERAVNEAVARG